MIIEPSAVILTYVTCATFPTQQQAFQQSRDGGSDSVNLCCPSTSSRQLRSNVIFRPRPAVCQSQVSGRGETE